MRPSTKAPLLAPLARRRTQLKEKGVTRPHSKIAPRLPAGSSDLAGLPKGRDFMRKKKSGGGAVQKQIDKYCKAMRRSTHTFKEGHRATSTAAEHYVRTLNDACKPLTLLDYSHRLSKVTAGLRHVRAKHARGAP